MEITNKTAPILLFAEGFASISIQFLVLRQVIPFVGSSVVITSIIISFFLGALAFGYERGGKVISDHEKKLSKNLIFAGLWLSISLSYPLVYFYFEFFKEQNKIILLLIFLLFTMTPIVFAVAQTIPILTNFIKANTTGEKAGNALLFSTIGNVVGGIITTTVIMYFLGISWGIIITSLTFILVGLFLSNTHKKTLLKITPIIIISLILNTIGTKDLIDEETIYANYKTIENNETKYFISNNSYSSRQTKNGKNVFNCIEKTREIIKTHFDENSKKDVLILGAGGFSIGENQKNLKCTYIDIDEKIKKIAERDFLKKPIDGDFIANDAQVFLRENKREYDVVIVDVFQNKVSIPELLATVQFYKSTQTAMKKDGLFITNIIQDPFGQDKFSQKIRNTIFTAFNGNCYTTISTESRIKEKSNVLYVCKQKENKNKENREIYTSLKSQSTIDFFNAFVK